MKKVLLPLIAAFALTASAQVIPNNFNYQGVIERTNAKVVVTFDLVDEAGNVVYTEDQMVQTNKDGAFTAVIGKVNAEAWNEAWMNAEQAYTVKATIDGAEVNCPLQAVPYANIATTVVGLDNIYKDIEDLSMANRETKTDIEDLKLRAENHDMTGAVAQTAYDMADANADAIAIISSDLQGLTEKSRDFASAADVVALQEETSAIQADLIQLQEDLVSTVATQEELDAVKLDLESVGLAADKAGEIASTTYEELQDLKEAIYSEEDGPVAAANMGLTMLSNVVTDLAEQVDANTEALAIVSSDLQGLTEKSRDFASAADVADLQEETSAIQANLIELQETLAAEGATKEDIDNINALLANMDENTAKANEIIDTLLEDVDGLKENVEILFSDEDGPIATLNQGFVQLSNRVEANTAAIEENTKAVEAVQAQLDGALYAITNEDDGMLTVIQNAVAANTEALEIVSSDLQGLTEKSRDFASATALTELEESYEAYTKDLEETLKESFGEAYDMITKNTEAINTILDQEDGMLASLQNTVAAEIEETNGKVAELDDVVAQLNSTVTNFITNFDEEYMTVIQEAIDAVDVTSEVQGIQEALRGKASVEAVTELEDQLAVVSNAVQNFEKSFNDEYMVPIQDALDAINVDLQSAGQLANQAGKVAYINAENIQAIVEALAAAGINVELVEE